MGTQEDELQDMDIDLPTSTYEIFVSRGQFPLREIEIKIYTPLIKISVARLSSYEFNPKTKQIVQKTENMLKIKLPQDC